MEPKYNQQPLHAISPQIKIAKYTTERNGWLTSVLTRNFISVSLQDRRRCKTSIFLLLALPLPDIALIRKKIDDVKRN